MVEFALILPLVVLLTFGIIEFAIAFNADSNINQAGRAGGRTAAILSTDPQMGFKAASAAATALDLSPGQVEGNPIVCVAPYNGSIDPNGTNCQTDPNNTTVSLIHPGTPGSPVWVIQDAYGDPPGTWGTNNDNWPVNQRHYGCPVGNSPGSFDKVVVYVAANHKLLVPGIFGVFFGNNSAPKFTTVAVFQLEPVPTNTCS
jgi:hypothetical protein